MDRRVAREMVDLLGAGRAARSQCAALLCPVRVVPGNLYDRNFGSWTPGNDVYPIANLFSLPRWLDVGFRVEFYIKIGIVLLGATLPFTLIIWAGPVAILQASREFAPTGGKPFVAFTAGVVINVILGFVLSVLVFGHYWSTLSH